MPSRHAYDPFKDQDIHKHPMAHADKDDDTAPLSDSYGGAYGYARQRLPPAARKQIDWNEAARLLARGRPVEEVAGLLACRPDRIWRNLKRSKRFRDRIQLEHERMKLEAELQFRSLGSRLASQLGHRADRLDARALQWLAGMLDITQVRRRGQGLGGRLGELASMTDAGPAKSGAGPAARDRPAPASDASRAAIEEQARAVVSELEALLSWPDPERPGPAGNGR